MNIGYVFIVVISGMAYFVSGIPTPDEMIANFDAAQKFYTSGAYDQALEAYNDVTAVESRFLDEEKVLVEFGQVKIPVKEASVYKIGQTYFKMIQEENKVIKSKEAADEAKEKARQLAQEYAVKSTEYYDQVQTMTKSESFKAQAQNQIVNTWYEVFDYDRVIQEGQELIDRYPNSPYVLDSMYNIGWAHYDKKDYDKSIETFNILVSRFPTSGFKSDRALFQIGESYYDQAKFREAIPNYQRLVDKMRINELTDQEIQRIQRDKLAGITDETALDLAAKAQLKVGASYANIGDFDNASTAYKRVAELFRFDQNLISEAYQRMADMYLERGDFERSIGAYRAAIDEVPDRIFAAKMQILIGQRYFEYNRYVESVREWRQYINSYSDIALRAGVNVDEAFFWLGRSYYQLGDEFIRKNEIQAGNENIDLALTTYSQLFTQFPDTELKERVYFYQGLAMFRYDDDDHKKQCIAKFDQMLTEFPQTPYKIYCYFFKARSYQALKSYADAIKLYQQIIQEYPNDPQIDSAWMEMAVTYKSSGSEEDALPAYLKVSSADKKLFTTARLLSSQYLYQQHKYDDVIRVVTEAVQDTSKVESIYRLSQLYIMRGNAYKNSNRVKESINDYTLAYNLNDPETQEMAAVYRAGAYIDDGQLETAERDLKELMTSKDEDVRKNAQMRLAIISVQQKKQDQAIQTYLELYKSATDETEKLNFLRNLVQLSFLSKDWKRVDEFNNMMIESPEAEGKKVENQEFYYKEEAMFNLALAYEAQGDTIKAKNWLIQGYKAFPKSVYSPDMLIKLGTYYLTVGQLREEATSQGEQAIDLAAEYFNEFIKNFSNTPYSEMAHYYLGFCYYNGRRFDEAYSTFKEFAQQYPNSEFTPEAIFYYADCKYNTGEMDESIQGFNIVISRFPNHDKAQEALYTRAWALMDIGREEEAIQSLLQLVEKFPKSQYAPHSLFSIADYYYNLQRYEESKAFYKRVLDEYPTSEVAVKIPDTIKELDETIAYLEFEKGYNLFDAAKNNNDDRNLYRQAAEVFEKVAKDFPHTEAEIGAYSNLGMCYEMLEQWAKAVEAYDMVIRRYEEGENVGEEARSFATQHKQYIVANKF